MVAITSVGVYTHRPSHHPFAHPLGHPFPNFFESPRPGSDPTRGKKGTKLVSKTVSPDIRF